jgi:uncharacterized membrane protein YphA (DoxX/SURF4 family)
VESAALLTLRLAPAAVVVAHGLRRLHRRREVERWASEIGLRRPRHQARLVSWGGIAVGAGLGLGLATPAASAGAVAMSTVVFRAVHRRAGFFVSARPVAGGEPVLVRAAMAATAATLRPGGWSLDAALGWDDVPTGRTAGLIAFTGVLLGVGHLLAFHRSPA